ncbi:TMEM65 [Symbiodinium sp. CCMP2592]|nr:TMEM65 [Symbiodinium sp. CCMP2592]CAE7591062.1 TMEM65 [Symbiodinium sp. CCMP2592]
MALFRVGFAHRAMIRSKLSSMRGRISQIATSHEAERPTPLQMRRLFVISAVPFVAFGIVDQSVLLYAGDAIDNTLGVALGLPTLAAAAMGQVMSDTCGVAFGGTIEAAALKLGLPLPGLTEAQQRLGSVKRVSTLGGVCGVILGCFIGMGNLLLIDLKAAERAKKEKELAKIMKTVMEDGRAVLHCDRATLWAVETEVGELWSTFADGIQGTMRIPKSESSLAGWVACNKELVNIPDVTQDPRWTKPSKMNYATKSMLCAPVVLDGKVIAVIQLLNKLDEKGDVVPFDQSDARAVKMMAGHTAMFMAQLL